MVVPDLLLDAVKRLAQNLYINAPTLSQVSVLCFVRASISCTHADLVVCVNCMCTACINSREMFCKSWVWCCCYILNAIELLICPLYFDCYGYHRSHR
jgi:hypothetical protein